MDDRRWRRRLGRFAICLIVTVSASYADIAVRQSGPYLVLGKNLPWSSRFNDTWVFQPQNPDQGICIFVSNNDSSSHTFTLNVWQTGDPTIRQYTGNESRFRPDIIQGEYSPVAANSTVTAYVHTSAAAVVALQTSGGSGSGTADIYVVMTRAAGCGPVNAGAMTVQGAVPDSQTLSADHAPVIVGGRSIDGIAKNMRVTSLGAQYSVDDVTCAQSGLVPIPTTLTDVYTTESYIANIIISNPTATSINVTIQDRQGTPAKLFGDVPVSGNSTILYAPNVFRSLTGIAWQASASGLVGQICAYQR
jgi:hypothetical protein